MQDILTFGVLEQMNYSLLALILLLGAALLLSAYVKIATVLSILRIGFGAIGLPSIFVTSGLALVLTYFVMAPVITESAREMDSVFKAQKVADTEQSKALSKGSESWKKFVLSHTDANSRELFWGLAKKIDAKLVLNSDNQALSSATDSKDSWRLLAPAFVVSQLRDAFRAGLSLLLPFLVIDIVVVGLLTLGGFESLPTQVIAIPLKLLLFVMVDGWTLITTNLVSGYM